MQKLSKLLIGTGILAGIVLVGLLVGWLGTRVSATGKGSGQPANEAPGRTSPPPVTPAPRPAEAPALPNPVAQPITSPTSADATTNLLADWEDKVDQILGGEGDDTNKVHELFALFPTLPEDGQAEVAQHLSNLLSDEDYAPLGELLKNAKLPESVLDTLMADVLNRPNSVKLPMFLELARNPEHAKAEESKDLLELYLDEDYGADWGQWQQKMQEWLKDNPD